METVGWFPGGTAEHRVVEAPVLAHVVSVTGRPTMSYVRSIWLLALSVSIRRPRGSKAKLTLSLPGRTFWVSRPSTSYLYAVICPFRSVCCCSRPRSLYEYVVEC